MDIIYKLPFPKEVCSKIFLFACKSPHNNSLGIVVLKHKIGFDMVDRFIRHEGIMVDPEGNVVQISNNLVSSPANDPLTFDIGHLDTLWNLTKIDFRIGFTGITGNIADLTSLRNLTDIKIINRFGNWFASQVTGDIVHLKSLPELTNIYLDSIDVSGDIAHLKSLLKLTEIGLYDTDVTGDIVHLESLRKLTYIGLSKMGVTGDIAHLKSLRKLTYIGLSFTDVVGDILHLKSRRKLKDIRLESTGVTGDKNAFHKYRKSAGLPYCSIYL